MSMAELNAEDTLRAVSRLAFERDSLRAELAEAKAEIARLHGLLNDREYELAVAKAAIGRLEDDISEWRPVVEAATALVTHRRGLNHWNGAIENDLINKLIDAVTAVEEGSKT